MIPKQIKHVALLTLGLALVLCFQNCSSPFGSSDPSSKTQFRLENNGQPYDGKPYIVEAPCLDGTVVESRLVPKSGGAILYRENCRDIEPRELSSSDLLVSADDRSKLQFKNRIFEVERPAIPLPGMVSWYYQLTGLLQARPSSIYIIDMFDNSASTIQDLKRQGHTVICTISAGTLEDWRPDTGSFQRRDIGNAAFGSNNERWLDTRSAQVRQAMLARLDIARDKGCHGIDFDSVDAHSNNSGFPLSSATQLEYNQFLAFAAHNRKLILSLNNVPDLAANLAPIFDFAIAEECFRYGECSRYQPFISLGKPVLAAEYSAYSSRQCAEAKASLISLVFMNRELDGSRYETCQ